MNTFNHSGLVMTLSDEDASKLAELERVTGRTVEELVLAGITVMHLVLLEEHKGNSLVLLDEEERTLGFVRVSPRPPWMDL